jgi:hypothetical protein
VQVLQGRPASSDLRGPLNFVYRSKEAAGQLTCMTRGKGSDQARADRSWIAQRAGSKGLWTRPTVRSSIPGMESVLCCGTLHNKGWTAWPWLTKATYGSCSACAAQFIQKPCAHPKPLRRSVGPKPHLHRCARGATPCGIAQAGPWL